MVEKYIPIVLTDKQRQELEELVILLGSVQGSHTELVSVLIPGGTNIHQVSSQLASEAGTAENIKSKATRTAVVTALEMIIRKLKDYKQTPSNGLAIYCGNVSEKEGGQDIQIWAYESPKPLNVRLYRCDKSFVIEPLKEMLEVQEIYGLLVMDRREATIGILEGKQIKVLRKLTSGVPGKIKAGGQCLAKDALIVKKNGKVIKIKDLQVGEEIKAFDLKEGKIIYTKCINKWEKTKDKYLRIISNSKFKHYFICSGEHIIFAEKDNKIAEVPAKELQGFENLIYADMSLDNKWEKAGIIAIEVKNEKIELIDIETECGNFFADRFLVHNSAARFERLTESLAKEFFKRVAEAMKIIFFDMPKLQGIIVGGPIPTKEEFLEYGELVTKLKEKVIAIKDIGYTDEHGLKLLVEASWEDLAQQEFIKEKDHIYKFFEILGKKREKAVYGIERTKIALERGAVDTLLISKTLDKATMQDFEKMAENIGAKVVIISIETQEGEQFLNLTKGVGAILRFALE